MTVVPAGCYFRIAAEQGTAGVKALPKAEGVSEIFVPGELERRAAQKRFREGIPIPDVTARNLEKVAEKLALKFPVR